MTKVIAADLASAKSDNMDALNTVIDSSTATISVLSSFIVESIENLKGGGYNSVRKKLGLYLNAFKSLKMICENYANISVNSNNSMLNYMEGNPELDDAKLSEINSQLNQMSGYIKYLRDQIAIGNMEKDFASELSGYEAAYNELKHIKELIENLPSTDASLYGAFERVITDIENISRAAAGIDPSTFTQSGMEAFRKGTACLYKYDPDLAIFKPIIDTSQMCDKAKTILEELERNWPDDLDPQRYIAIQTALTLLDKGIQYSQDYRHFISKKTGLPTYMDCSSYVTYCLVAAGIDIDAGAYTGTYVNSDKFVSINRSDLVPGDVGLLNTSTSGGNTNHIGLYLGKDDKGVGVWIEMAGGGVFVSHKDKGWGVYYRYTDYDDTYQP